MVKSVFWSLTLALAIFLTGCGGDKSEKVAQNKAPDKSSSAAEQTENSVKPDTLRSPRSDMKITEGTLEELFSKYGPEEMDQAEIDKQIASIKWTTNENASALGSSEAKKGGTFVYGMTSYPATLRTEGENSNSVFNTQLSALVYQSMTGLDTITMETVPGLADKWAIGEDKQTFYFHVDPKAKWTDGNKVRSFDFVSSWDFLTSDGLKDPFTQDYWHKFDRPVALSESIVMIKAKGVEWRLFMSAGGMTVYPEHIIGRITAEEYMNDYHQKLMPGTGPYLFDSAETNQFITLKRNPDFWCKDKPTYKGMYNFEKIRYVFYTEQPILLEVFRAGEIDFQTIGVARRWAEEYTAEAWEPIANNHVVRQRVYNDAPNGMSGIVMNMRRWPFNDKKVRMAFSHLRNRKKLMETIFYNEYVYMDSFFPNSPYANPDNVEIRYDPDYAIELLSEAGYEIGDSGYLEKDGKVLELTLNYMGDNRVETLFQEDMEYAGIKINLRQVDWARQIRDLNERNFTILSIAYSGLLFPNPESSFHSKFADLDNTNNVWGFKNDRVDELSVAYNTEFDVNKRIEMVQEIDKYLVDKYMTMLGWYSNNIRVLYWNKFGTPEFVISRFTSASNAHTTPIEYWWFDDKKSAALKAAKANESKLPAEPEIVKYWENHLNNQ